ncbi:MAG TPA: hypothetical protein VFJ15_15150 [Oleiagrimonas sp.]|nr:hypothetical protein [Oleiagrimonas sp.]
MLWIISIIVALLITFAALSAVVEKFPRISYFIYHFNGSMFVICVALQVLVFYTATGKRPGTTFLIIAMFFYLMWLVKIIAIVVNSPNERWWMLLLKFWLGAVGIIVFPLGILSAACHEWFVVKKIQAP